MPSSSSSSSVEDTTAPICLCCSDCYEGQGGDQGLAAAGNVRAYDGVATYAHKDWKEASGFNMPFGNEVAYNNLDPAAHVGYGNGWMPHDLASLTIENDRVLYRIGPNQTEAFYPTGGGNYEAAYYVRDLLYYHSDSSGEGYTLLDPHGRRKEFDGEGKLVSFADAFGHTGVLTYDIGKLQTVEVSSSSGSSSSGPGESWRYEFHWDDGPNLLYVTLFVNDRAVTKRRYRHANDKLEMIQTYVNSTVGAGEPDWGEDADLFVDVVYFSYNNGLLQHVIGNNAFRQIKRVFPNWPDSGSPDLSEYADVEYASYDGSNRVTQVKTHGGRYTYGLAYSTNEDPPSGLNDWTAKTEVTQPDGSLHTLYFNRIGQVILRQVDEQQPSSSSSSSSSAPVKRWYPLYQQFEEVTGRLVLSAGMAAIATVDEGEPALVTLNATEGMLTLYGYTNRNLTSVSIKEGESSGSSGSHDPILRLTRAYDDDITVDGLGPVYFLTSETVYRDDAGLEECTTTFINAFYADTFQMEQRTTNLPVVSPEENGSGTPAVVDEYFDEWGYQTKEVDARGTATEFSYDKPRGAMIERIDDAGLYRKNLVTNYEPDDLGRTILTQEPEHDIVLNGDAETVRTAQWTYHKDREDEVWQFSGYTLDDVGQIVGPVTVVLDDETPPSGKTGWRQSSRIDAKFTGEGIPAPDETFDREDWVRWSLQLFDKGGEAKESRLYWDIPAEEDNDGYGAKSTNYGETLFDYDSAGRQNKVTSPGGTIDRTEFNCSWTGTVDGGYGDNMVMTRANDYDDDGNHTKGTLVVDPTNAALDRITDYEYDWRNRRVDTMTSVEVRKGSADQWGLKTSVTYDNRDLVTGGENFYKLLPGASSSSSAPPEYVRCAKMEARFDARGRRFRTRRIAVNIETGEAGAYLEGNKFFDQGNNVVRHAPEGQTGYTVNHYDALSRRTNTFKACDPPASSSSSSSGPFDPADVANSLVAEQTDSDYDDAGNTISTIKRERFDTTTDTGPLDDPEHEPKARVSYAAMYPDGIGRTVATANYGTNGGDPWSRDNDSIPESSDTVLVSQTHFDDAGNATEQTDPTGRVDRTEYDHADRKTISIENYQPESSSLTSSSSSGTPANDINKTTRFTYTDDSVIRTKTSDNDSTGPQTSEWEYNVTQTGGSKLASNRLVSRVILPPRSVSSSSSSSSGPEDNSITQLYNAQSQVIERTDQAGTTHGYDFDKLGRGLTDTVTAYGSGIDNFTGVLETVWDVRGLP